MTASQVLAAFPNLRPGFSITSPATPYYNCIAWAANDSANFWWPAQTAYWPQPHPSVATIAVFHAAFAALGYTHVNLDDSFDPMLEKVAIYIEPATGLVTHMARQLDNGRWTSKLGKSYDIEHITAACLNGKNYGEYLHCLGRTKNP